jgi:LacI family transcriptional regulator
VVEGLVAAGYPCLMYNRRLRSRRGNFIVLDNVRASRDLTRHLVGLGHHRIGFVSGLPNISTASERLRGYRAALREAGLSAEPDLIRPGAFQAGTAEEAARGLLKGHVRPTAIVASNDLMALGVIRAASDLGVRIPDDLAVVGFDDIEIADHPQVQLTTMAQQKAEMGRLAALGILEIIRGGARLAGAPLQQILAPTLIIRRTCGALFRTGVKRGPAQAHAAAI